MAITNLPLGVTAVMLPELDFDEQLALCRRLGITHYSLRPRTIPEQERGKPWGNWGNHKFDLTPTRLVNEAAQIKDKLSAAGLTPFGTVPAVNIQAGDDELKLHFQGAQLVGAGRVRVAPLAYPKELFDYPALLDRIVAGYRHAVDLAKPFGVKIVIETHCRSIATSPGLAWNICRHFDPVELGVIFDVANFHIEGGLVPHLAVSVLEPYIDHVHIGGSQPTHTGYDANGFRKPGHQMCPMTEAHTYIPDWIAALSGLNRVVPLIIENYTANMTGARRLTQSVHDLRRVLEAA